MTLARASQPGLETLRAEASARVSKWHSHGARPLHLGGRRRPPAPVPALDADIDYDGGDAEELAP